MTRHLGSVELTVCNSESVLGAIITLFQKDEIPFKNLVSMLMDSCAVMRGSKNGVETKIRSNHAPHLLDIDGDSCHHIHNAAKRLFKPHSDVASTTRAIHNDLKWTPDYVDQVRLVVKEVHIFAFSFGHIS